MEARTRHVLMRSREGECVDELLRWRGKLEVWVVVRDYIYGDSVPLFGCLRTELPNLK